MVERVRFDVFFDDFCILSRLSGYILFHGLALINNAHSKAALLFQPPVNTDRGTGRAILPPPLALSAFPLIIYFSAKIPPAPEVSLEAFCSEEIQIR